MLWAVGNTGLIALVNKIIESFDNSMQYFPMFIGLLLFSFIIGVATQMFLNSLWAGLIYDIRMDLVANILASSLERIEQLDSRLYASLTGDVENIVQAYTVVPKLFLHSFTIACGIGYLYYLSPQYLMVFFCFLAFGLLVVGLLLGSMKRLMLEKRIIIDKLFIQFEALIKGFKELQLNKNRRIDFVNKDVGQSGRELKKASVTSANYMAFLENWLFVLIFSMVGTLIYLGNNVFVLDSSVTISFIFAILFLIGSFGTLMASVGPLIAGDVAIKKIEGLELKIDKPDMGTLEGKALIKNWSVLNLVDVTYDYASLEGAKSSFSLGPINLEVKKGDLLFFIGGNGSGKSTLAKVLTGLYSPTQGHIELDGSKIGENEIGAYREMFSTIFFDFYLFERLPTEEDGEVDMRSAKEFVELLELQQKIELSDGKISTLKLSQGQRKRIALLASFLEKRDIFLFDEWAADQDPHYREVFYKQILPQLKKDDKTVFVISHDDRYFGMADRILHLEDGKFRELSVSSFVS